MREGEEHEVERSQEAERHEQGSSCSSVTASTVDAIDSVISSSLSASLFPLKWRLIRDRLNRLHAGLADVASTGSSGAPVEFADLLCAIAATAAEAKLLVRRSAGEHYGGGKLRLRSDLDVVVATLDAHISRLEEIYASGALTHARALVVPRPGPNATLEDVRFYVRDLFSRLKVGGAEMRRQAMAALNEVQRDDERCVKIVVSDVADGIGVLVALLECPDAGVQEGALEAVSVIAGFDAHRGDLVFGGVIAPVVRVLDSGAVSAKEQAARVLWKLTENSDNAWAVAAHGGVTALLNVCCDHRSSGGELVCMACRVLRSLAGVDEIRKYMVAEAGALPVFLSLSQNADVDEAAQIQAIEFLVAVASGDSSIKQVALQEGAVEALVRVLDPCSLRSSKAREVALQSIDTLCFSSPTCIQRLLSAGFLTRILFFLRNGDNAVQHSALKAAHRLCSVSEESKKAMGEAGFMPELVNILQAKSFEVREMAAEALCAMVSVQRNRRRFVQEDHNVGQILQLLSPEGEKPSAAKRFLLSTLMHLTDSTSGRRKIMSSEHVRNLEKLAETNVADAKRIVKKLAGNKLRSILHGIWSM